MPHETDKKTYAHRETWMEAHMEVAVTRNEVKKVTKKTESTASDVMLVAGDYRKAKENAIKAYTEYLEREDKDFL